MHGLYSGTQKFIPKLLPKRCQTSSYLGPCRSPSNPNHYPYGEEGHLKDEDWQNGRPISGDDQGSRNYRCYHGLDLSYQDYS